tara:strand:- start:578 stop:1000 length:423 start_codon:yes stop_codon:yes gene_type:complete
MEDYMIVEGNAYWASLVAPNTTYEPMYTINLVVDEATAKDFAERGHSIREMEEGPAVVIKRKVNGPNGMVRKAPRLLDADKNDVDVLVGNGSKVRVQYQEYDWTYNNKSGKGLDLQAVQIIDLVPYKAGDGDELLNDEEF